MTREEATLDPLTRIMNRGGFDRACRQWMTTEKLQFVLAMVDVDNFKRINDVHGHGLGDRALTAVAQALKNSVRQDRDVVARIGGDEFAMLISDLSLPQAESRLRMLSASLAGANVETASGAPLTLTLSCGLAELSAGDTVESLMERADRALYEAKNLGKNRVVATSQTDAARAAQALTTTSRQAEAEAGHYGFSLAAGVDSVGANQTVRRAVTTLDWPPPRRRRRRGRLLLFGLLAAILLGGGTAVSYYIESLWFDSLGFSSVFWKTINIQALIFAAFFAATFAVLYGSFLLLRPSKLAELTSPDSDQRPAAAASG